MFKHEIVTPIMFVFSPGYDILGAEVSKMYCMTVGRNRFSVQYKNKLLVKFVSSVSYTQSTIYCFGETVEEKISKLSIQRVSDKKCPS